MMNSIQWASLCSNTATSSTTSSTSVNSLVPAYSWLNISAWNSVDMWQQSCQELISTSAHSDPQNEESNNKYGVYGKKTIHIFNFVKSFL